MTGTLEQRAAKARHDLHQAVADVRPELIRPDRRPTRLVLTVATLVVAVGLAGVLTIARSGRSTPPANSVEADRRQITLPAAGLAFSVPHTWNDDPAGHDAAVTVAALTAPNNEGLIVQAAAVGSAPAEAMGRQIAANLLTNSSVTATITPDRTVTPDGQRLDWTYVGGHVTAYVFLNHGLAISFFFRNVPADQAAAVLASYRQIPRVDPGWRTTRAQDLSMRLPQQWASQSPTAPTAFGPVGRNVTFVAAGLSGFVAITPLDTNDPSQAATSLQQQLTSAGGHAFRTSRATIANTRAVKLEFTSATQLLRPIGFPLAHRDYLIPVHGHVVLVYLVGPDTSDARAMFDTIAHSITVD